MVAGEPWSTVALVRPSNVSTDAVVTKSLVDLTFVHVFFAVAPRPAVGALAAIAHLLV